MIIDVPILVRNEQTYYLFIIFWQLFLFYMTVFNVGQYRRETVQNTSHDFFRPDNAEAMKIRK